MRKTPLYDAHREAGARMVDFHGWQMPVQYEGILDEVRRVRTQGGLFDLCHMGRLEIRGPDREALVERVFSRPLAKVRRGRARYGFLLDDRGYPIDDVLVYRDDDVVHVVINATGRETDPAWIRRQQSDGGFDATVEDVSDRQTMLALQGPVSEMTLQPLCGLDLSGLKYYAFARGPVADVPCLIARTGYTGEDGFEVFFPPDRAAAVWNAILGSGRRLGVRPIGLGARDTLRLEAGMPLYGQEIGPDVHPLEAGLAFGVDLDKSEAIGVAALRALGERGPARAAVSLVADRGPVARTGCDLHQGRTRVGEVTSGTYSPTLERNIARGLVQAEASDPGTRIDAEIRGKRYPFEVIPSPFYRRKS